MFMNQQIIIFLKHECFEFPKLYFGNLIISPLLYYGKIVNCYRYITISDDDVTTESTRHNRDELIVL